MAEKSVTRKTPKRTHPKTKVCADCGRRRKADAFGKNPRMASGLKSYCRECSADRQCDYVARTSG